MKIISKILAIFFVLLAIWGVKEVYFSGDSNKDIAYSIFKECAYVNGCDSVFEIPSPQGVNSNFTPTQFYKLKRQIFTSDVIDENIEQEISKLGDIASQGFLYALLANRFLEEGKENLFQQYATQAYLKIMASKRSNTEMYCWEIVRILGASQKKVAQEYAVEFLLFMGDSMDRNLLVYMLMYNSYSRAKLIKRFRQNAYKSDRNLHEIILRNSNNIAKMDRNHFEKYFVYSYTGFRIAWGIKGEYARFNYPIFSYMFYMFGDKKKAAEYKLKSLSYSQRKAMRGGLSSYVEYAVKVFCFMGDVDSALELLSWLPQGHKKNLLIKRVSRYLSYQKDFLGKVEKSEIFNSDKFSFFDFN